VFWFKEDKFLKSFNTLIVFLELVMSEAFEVQSFDAVWLHRSVKDSLGSFDNLVPVLHFVVAYDHVGICCFLDVF